MENVLHLSTFCSCSSVECTIDNANLQKWNQDRFCLYTTLFGASLASYQELLHYMTTVDSLKWMRSTFLPQFQGCWCWIFDYDSVLIVRAWPILNFCIFGMYRVLICALYCLCEALCNCVFKSNTNKVILFISTMILVLYISQYTHCFFSDPSNVTSKHLWERYVMEAMYFTVEQLTFYCLKWQMHWNVKLHWEFNIEITSCILFCVMICKITVFISLLWTVCMFAKYLKM